MAMFLSSLVLLFLFGCRASFVAAGGLGAAIASFLGCSCSESDRKVSPDSSKGSDSLFELSIVCILEFGRLLCCLPATCSLVMSRSFSLCGLRASNSTCSCPGL